MVLPKVFRWTTMEPTERQNKACNLSIRCGSKIQLWNKLAKEVNFKRFAGPFKKIPFKNFIQSPVGLVGKANLGTEPGGTTRLIFHLSWPENSFVNHHTPDHLCKVKYKDLDDATAQCMSVTSKHGKCYSTVHECYQ